MEGTTRRVDDRLVELERALARHRAVTIPEPERQEGAGAGGTRSVSRASVALVVRPQPTDLEVLLIRRAVAPGDPWSGHMALPGGKRSPGDADGLDTSMRETHEEVGVDLRRCGSLLGRLDDVSPGSGAPRIVVSPYVFAVPPGTGTTPNHEVDLAVWIPLRCLAEPGATTEYLHALASGELLRFPAIGYDEHVIWGLTHRILSQFLEIARTSGAGGVQ